ncbi:hypothetical protein FISHEDRAFT_63263 [Fistulina hepatica ATCC 64428]|uniref:Alpha/beta-hydrolase n=1 Tax=Fistulina hepatica ATCC 64428 TaxID=1128425 RepID=A0A0D7APX8_9AGAR|nr:hypothetical protein FISHEDRAFT_63263 [Fistulina hepatica ATCC 64428]
MPNHGHRLTKDKSNRSFKDGNERHAIDMFSFMDGAARDVSFLIDHLPSYLFPHEERTVSQWGMLGVSLGGHAAWQLLCYAPSQVSAIEPRITFGIPVISCPDYLNLMTLRARKNGVSVDPPIFPKSFVEFVRKRSALSIPYQSTDGSVNPFIGKKILALAGRDDTLVPWSAGGEEFVAKLEVGEHGIKEAFVQDDTKHHFTPEMSKLEVLCAPHQDYG